MLTVQGPNRSPEETITHMVQSHQEALLRLCYAYLHDQEAARDAVQETFLTASRRLHSYQGKAAEKTWLTSIAMNVCRDVRRSAWFRFQDRRVTPEMLPIAAVPASQEDHEITAAVMNLPVHLREVVLLYYYQELPITEIAPILHITHQAVSSRLQRARSLLKTTLERSQNDV